MVRKPPRPASVTVFAILQLVFGTIALFCGGFNLIGLIMIQNAAPGLSSGPFAASMDLELATAAQYPAYLPSKMVLACLTLLNVLIMLLTGIGLLLLQRWARWLSFVFAALLILICLGVALVDLTMRAPAADAFATQMAKNPAQAAQAPGIRLGVYLGVVGDLLAIPYALLLCFFLTRPKVRDAFAGIDRRLDDDYDDRDRDRDRYDDRDRDRYDDRDRDRYDRDRDRDRDRDDDDRDRDRGARERDPDDRIR